MKRESLVLLLKNTSRVNDDEKVEKEFLANAKFNADGDVDKFELAKIVMRASGLGHHVTSERIEKWMGFRKVYPRLSKYAR